MTTWAEQLAPFTQSDQWQRLNTFLDREYASTTVYPPRPLLGEAFRLTPFDQVKVVILGQDPYHSPNQANGLAFSVNPGEPIPPSLRNIYQELESDLNLPHPRNGDLRPWAQQGVLLLNTVLSVRAGQPHSHANQGWELMTHLAIQTLSQREEPIVFLLWGRPAQTKATLIDTSRHAIIASSHPSPLSAYRGFLGSRPFSRTNAYLTAWGHSPINWRVICE